MTIRVTHNWQGREKAVAKGDPPPPGGTPPPQHIHTHTHRHLHELIHTLDYRVFAINPKAEKTTRCGGVGRRKRRRRRKGGRCKVEGGRGGGGRDAVEMQKSGTGYRNKSNMKTKA
ncbi:hypothetical protein INR49_002352, partial [Caranx melampygus]